MYEQGKKFGKVVHILFALSEVLCYEWHCKWYGTKAVNHVGKVEVCCVNYYDYN